MKMQSNPSVIVVLGTGGTIAGTAAEASDAVGYRSAQLPVAALLAGVPGPTTLPIESEQVAQIDSKDMDHATWQRLAVRVAHHLARAEVHGVVITHGTDTMEETAYFLQRVLAPAKPVVITGAMRPATSSQADGPRNLRDAVTLAGVAAARGVVVVFAGAVLHGSEVRKVHPYRLHAFDAGDAGPIGHIADGRLSLLRDWPAGDALGLAALRGAAATWPRVEIVVSHAGAGAAIVSALCAQGVHGIVVAATGNGTVHRDLESALCQAQAEGVAVLCATRCVAGQIVGPGNEVLPFAADLTPVTARVELMLRLMSRVAPSPSGGGLGWG